MNSYKNKTVVITGASSGIGRETARAFAREGAEVVLVSRSRKKLERVAEEIHRDGGRAFVIPADVSSEQSVTDAVRTIVKKFGGIDILFNNAGKSYVGRTDQVDFVEKTREMFDTDFLGTVRVTQAVLPGMKKQGHGQIGRASCRERV